MTEMSAAEAAVVARFDAAEPAPESWRGDDGLREAVAEAIFDHHPMSRWGAENLADAVLALPEVAALRAKALPAPPAGMEYLTVVTPVHSPKSENERRAMERRAREAVLRMLAEEWGQ